MNSEIEAKFLQQDHAVIRQRLQALGAELEVPMRSMRRVTIDNEHMRAKNAFLRVRDEGSRTTMTYKQFDELSVDGAKEIEITVEDFEKAVDMLAAAGLPYKSFQESRRETWKLGSTEIVLDKWPWLDTYIEIEGASIDDIKAVAAALELSWDDAVFGDVMAAYRKQYPQLSPDMMISAVREVKFDAPLPDLLK